jgi:hypothetical protein
MNDALAIVILIKHSIHLKQHTDMLRQHFNDFAQKISFEESRLEAVRCRESIMCRDAD